jgi:hypothetical protein
LLVVAQVVVGKTPLVAVVVVVQVVYYKVLERLHKVKFIQRLLVRVVFVLVVMVETLRSLVLGFLYPRLSVAVAVEL